MQSPTPPPLPPLQNLVASVLLSIVNDIIFHLVEWVFLVAGSSSEIYLCCLCLFFFKSLLLPPYSKLHRHLSAYCSSSYQSPCICLCPCLTQRSHADSQTDIASYYSHASECSVVSFALPIVLFLEPFDSKVPRTVFISDPPNLSSCKNEMHRSCVEKSALRSFDRRGQG